MQVLNTCLVGLILKTFQLEKTVNHKLPVLCSQKVDKGKCTLVQALRLCTGRMAHRGSRGIALPFHDHGTRRGWGVSVTPQLLFTSGKDAVPIVQEAGWAPGPVRTGAENLTPAGIRSPNHPGRSQSLYRLCYPAHYFDLMSFQIHMNKPDHSLRHLFNLRRHRTPCRSWIWVKYYLCTGVFPYLKHKWEVWMSEQFKYTHYSMNQVPPYTMCTERIQDGFHQSHWQ